MKIAIVLTALTMMSFALPNFAYAETREIVSESASAASFDHQNSSLIFVEFYAAGCAVKQYPPRLALKHISTKDITPGSVLKANGIRQYEVVMQVVVVENRPRGPMCAISKLVELNADLDQLFISMAPSIEIDLAAKKAHYTVIYQAPKVSRQHTFTAFDN